MKGRSMIELYALKIEEPVDADLYKLCEKLISIEKRQYIHGLQRPETKRQSVYAEVLVRYLFLKRYGGTNSSIKVLKNDYGKPYIMTEQMNRTIAFQYNISHSGEWILAGIGKQEVGVDIEAVGKERLGIAKRFFHPKEYAYMVYTPMEQRNKLFYDMWCLKESYVKYMGAGLSIKFHTFQVKLKGAKAEIESENSLQTVSLHMQTYPVANNYSAAACSMEELPHSVSYISFKELYKFINQAF